eukprot:TRINITY_DN1863_c0_g1_i1.p1 TRINITY_DN1863_c0_g1~~TRINITY_DN1863_c0_g1_i1.p1  ORF type:complete len:277 (-),score=148.11 TRINITY_DN1863_c0_g1_i1:7-771(-)
MKGASSDLKRDVSAVNLDSKSNEQQILRQLEVEAYQAVISALFCQGEFSWRKEETLMQLRSILHISDDFHRREMSRVHSDQGLVHIRAVQQLLSQDPPTQLEEYNMDDKLPKKKKRKLAAYPIRQTPAGRPLVMTAPPPPAPLPPSAQKELEKAKKNKKKPKKKDIEEEEIQIKYLEKELAGLVAQQRKIQEELLRQQSENDENEDSDESGEDDEEEEMEDDDDGDAQSQENDDDDDDEDDAPLSIDSVPAGSS